MWIYIMLDLFKHQKLIQNFCFRFSSLPKIEYLNNYFISNWKFDHLDRKLWYEILLRINI